MTALALKQSRRSRKSDEHKLQCQIADLLRQARAKDVLYWSVPNGMFSTAVNVNRQKAAGLHPGVADLTIILPGGRAVMLEVKAKGGVQSPAQLIFQFLCETNGTPYHIVYSLDEAIAVLTDIGALRKRAAA